MTLNFFTAQQGFQKTLIDPSFYVGGGKDFTPSIKKDDFSTQKSAQNNLKDSGQNDNFAKMVKDLKDKEKTETTSKAQTPIAAKPDQVSSALLTRETAPSAVNNVVRIVEAAANTSINLANIAALNAEIQRLIEGQSKDSDALVTDEVTLTVTPDTDVEEVKSILALLASFVSEEGSDSAAEGGEVEALELAPILEKIEELASSDEAIAITSGLNPQQLTQLQEHIQKYLKDELNKQDSEALEALAAQFVALTPPPNAKKAAKDNAVTQSRAQVIPEQQHAPVKKELVQQDRPTQVQASKAQGRFDTRYDARYDGSTQARADIDSGEVGKPDFKAALKDAGTAPDKGSAQNAGQRFLQATNLAQGGSASLTFDPLAPQNPTLTSGQSAPSPLQSSLTNVVIQSQSAGSGHPATQMVSATIQKAMKAGEDTTIKLKLDPPELGRVDIKMSIDKDNSVKLVVTAEKPETYMMLKQDAEVLQRALSDAGLDTNGDLSFELADQNSDFDGGKRGNNNGQNARRADNDNLDETIIETTMDWSVDPNTGLMHYNALV